MIEPFFQSSPQWWYKPGGKMGFEYGRSHIPPWGQTKEQVYLLTD